MQRLRNSKSRNMKRSASKRCRFSAWVPILLLLFCRPETARAADDAKFKGALLDADQVSAARITGLKKEGYNAIVLGLTENGAEKQGSAARQVRQNGLDLYYWIEIARNPALADAHPEWMASIQTHKEWRRFFPKLPPLKTNEVVKNYPWVPVLYQETFPVHLEHVKRLLEGKPSPKGIFLNDLQGAPSACGCGHHLCRWTTDYGPIKTASRLPNDAAAKFVAEVRNLAPQATVIPVWTTECEEQDAETFCAGVGCFKGACWREFTAQLTPVAEASETLAALMPYKAFQRDSTNYGATAGWLAQGLNLFATMPLRYEAKLVAAGRIIAVLEGWDATAEEIRSQIEQVQKAGAAGWLVAFVQIEQSWEARVFDAARLAR